MNYIIDTSVLIEIENDNETIINKVEKLRYAPKSELYTTIFNFCEYYYGLLNKAKKEQGKKRLEQYKILQTNEKTGMIFCELLFELKKKGRLLRQFDIFIAAFAIEHNMTLVTLDSHFDQIPHLKKTILTTKS